MGLATLTAERLQRTRLKSFERAAVRVAERHGSIPAVSTPSGATLGFPAGRLVVLVCA